MAGLCDKRQYKNDEVCEDYGHIVPFVGYKKDSTGKTLGIFYNLLYTPDGPTYLSTASTDKLNRVSCKGLSSAELDNDPYCIRAGGSFAIAL